LISLHFLSARFILHDF